MRSIALSTYLKGAFYALRNNLATEHVYPQYASFKLTRACPLTCSYCKYWRERPELLDTDGVKAVIDNLARSSIAVLSFEGGEPLYRHDIIEILQHARRYPLILQMTTAGVKIDKAPLEHATRYLDFLHISIDEAHENLHLYDELERFRRFGIGIAAQIVVTRATLSCLEKKIRACAEAGARAVIMPATHEDELDDQYPDPDEFRRQLRELRCHYPGVILTPDGFLDKINLEHGCSAASIIVDCDGHLFYPCSVLDRKTIDLSKRSLMEFLASRAAREGRAEMGSCERRCGWYQYFAVGSYIEPKYALSSARPYLAWREHLTGLGSS